MFRRKRYQHGSLNCEARRRGPAVWVYRWWEKVNGKPIRRKLQVGTLKQYPTESAAHAAVDAPRLTINTQSGRNSRNRTTLTTLWEHYSSEELPLKEISTQDVYTDLRKEPDSPALGGSASGRDQNCRSRTLATDNEFGGRNQGQGQERNVGLVFTRRSLGVLWLQSDLVGTGGRQWRKARSERRCTGQCQTPESTASVVLGTGQARPCGVAISGSTPGLVDRGLGHTTRRNRSSALDGLRLHERSLLHSALLLLAKRRAFESDQDGSIGEILAHASGGQECTARMEGTEPVPGRNGFRISVAAQEGTKAARSGFGAEPEDQACIRQSWNHGRRLAYVSAFCREHSGGHGRASTHHPRLLASQQPQRHQPILAGDIKDQASRSRETGRCDSTHRIAVAKQVKPNSVNLQKNSFCSAAKMRRTSVFFMESERLLDPNGP